MRTPNRPSILIAAALAVATPLLAGRLAWRYADDIERDGPAYVLLYWPHILFSHLPARAEDVLTRSALDAVLLYFAGYLLACHLVRMAAAAVVRRARASRSVPPDAH